MSFNKRPTILIVTIASIEESRGCRFSSRNSVVFRRFGWRSRDRRCRIITLYIPLGRKSRLSSPYRSRHKVVVGLVDVSRGTNLPPILACLFRRRSRVCDGYWLGSPFTNLGDGCLALVTPLTDNIGVSVGETDGHSLVLPRAGWTARPCTVRKALLRDGRVHVIGGLGEATRLGRVESQRRGAIILEGRWTRWWMSDL